MYFMEHLFLKPIKQWFLHQELYTKNSLWKKSMPFPPYLKDNCQSLLLHPHELENRESPSSSRRRDWHWRRRRRWRRQQVQRSVKNAIFRTTFLLFEVHKVLFYKLLLLSALVVSHYLLFLLFAFCVTVVLRSWSLDVASTAAGGGGGRRRRRPRPSLLFRALGLSQTTTTTTTTTTRRVIH